MSDLLETSDNSDTENHTTPHSPADLPAMMAAFSNMLSRGLSQTAAQITSATHADLQNIGVWIEHIEKKTDQSAARIQDIQDQLEMALFKIDDLENRSRRYNFVADSLLPPQGPNSGHSRTQVRTGQSTEHYNLCGRMASPGTSSSPTSTQLRKRRGFAEL